MYFDRNIHTSYFLTLDSEDSNCPSTNPAGQGRKIYVYNAHTIGRIRTKVSGTHYDKYV